MQNFREKNAQLFFLGYLSFLGASPRKFDSPLSVVRVWIAGKAWDVEDILLHRQQSLPTANSDHSPVLRKNIFHLDFLLYPPFILLVSVLFYSLLLLQMIVFHEEKEGEIN